MSTRRQRSRKNQPPEPPPTVESDLSVFAGRVVAEKARRRDDQRARREAKRHAEDRARLLAAKDAAAAGVKRLRGRDGISAVQRAEADAAYRDALAAVVAAETGQAPSWAPTPTPATAGEDGDRPVPPGEGDETAADAPETAGAEAGTEA